MIEKVATRMQRLEVGDRLKFSVDGTRVHGELLERLSSPGVDGERVIFRVISPHRKGVPSKFAFDLGELATDKGVDLIEEGGK